ncbi:MAG: hypothetical protein ABI665_26055, partial [Vicinamibacterales bacterium]
LSLHDSLSQARLASAPIIELPAELPRPAFVPIVATQDDGLLGEIDGAIQLRTVAELRAIDELTPFQEPQ